MKLLPLVKGWGPCARRLERPTNFNRRGKLRKPPAMLAVASILCGILSGFVAPAKAIGPEDSDGSIAARAYVQLASTAQGDAAATSSPQPAERRVKLADADSLFGAMKQLLDKDSSEPEQPMAAPKYAAPAYRSAAESPPLDATFVGTKVCLNCHASQADSFGHTLMGRLVALGEKSKQQKLECETCHGPASVHVRSAGCAACHGEGGVSSRPGIPSLAGLGPDYLVSALKEYATGRRKHELMRAIASGLSEGDIHKIAHYYSRQIPARAQTPPVGDASAGKASTHLCASCHGERGTSEFSGVPSLAGQDAQYLATATRAFSHGTQNKALTCAPCHGERGVSRTSGIPNLAGLDPQYLVKAMKEFNAGERKSTVMREILSGVDDVQLNAVALYYALQSPSRAQTAAAGDPSAGRAASAACAGCHGQEGISSSSSFPSLAGQEAGYLAKAIRDYKSGSNKDPIMMAAVASLDERTINDIASYYASLQPVKPSITQAVQGAAKEGAVLVRNWLASTLDDRTIADVASYYASQQPVRSSLARGEPGGPVPAGIGAGRGADGSSVGGIISFRSDDPSRTPEQNNAICLNCHERGERAYWKGSTHEVRNVACTNCHTVMKSVSAQRQLKTAFEPETCFQCHKDRRAQMYRSSHMPMREGKIVCSNCHNPHGSVTAALIRENSVNENCYKCHAEKRGPFLWEHAPVRENCLNCHDPHGSINEASLKMSRPRLCFECHTLGHGQIARPGSYPKTGTTPPGNPIGNTMEYAVGRACNNCHTLIHGSNSPAGNFFQR